MTQDFLTYFDKKDPTVFTKDIPEWLGDKCLSLWQMGFGKTIHVYRMPEDESRICFKNQAQSTCLKVIRLVSCLILFPISIPLALLGRVLYEKSKSRKLTLLAFNWAQNVLDDGSQKTIFCLKKPQVTDLNRPTGNLRPSHPIYGAARIIEPKDQLRQIPPLSGIDTAAFDGRLNQMVSAHGQGRLFKDREIIAKEKVVAELSVRNALGHCVIVNYTKHNKPIVLQQATRGCTAAVTAMIALDHGKEIDPIFLASRNLGTDEEMLRDLLDFGLNARLFNCSDLSELRDLLKVSGSCICWSGGDIGGHVIVVDEVSDDLSQIRLRDPYHGWEITVTAEAFKRVSAGTRVIHVI